MRQLLDQLRIQLAEQEYGPPTKRQAIFSPTIYYSIISSIWPDGIILDWIEGRKGDTELVWSSKYLPHPVPLVPSFAPCHLSPQFYFGTRMFKANCREANAILTMGEETVMAKTDGSLQIQIPDDKNPGRKILWNRQYYAIPLEVPYPSTATVYSPCFLPPMPICDRLTVGETILSRRQRKRNWGDHRS